MVKEERPVLLKTILVVIVFLVVEAAAFLYFMAPGGMSGFSIVDVSEAYSKFYPHSKIFLIIQWAILVVLLVFVYFKNIGIHKRNKEIKSVNLKSAVGKSKTNLDALYLILKERKTLSVKTASKLFNIKTDLGMEWARILEAGDLVTIDYPGIGSPLIKIVEEEKLEEEQKDKKLDKKQEGKEAEKEKKQEEKGISQEMNQEKKQEKTKIIQEKTKPKKEDIKKEQQGRVKKPLEEKVGKVVKKKVSKKKKQ